MAFDGLVLHSISKELQNHIIGGKIDKIFEPNSNEVLLGIYCNGIKYALDLVVSSNNYRLCLTNFPKPNPSFAPNFCMVLRKHLLNTKIVSIETLSLERIVIIEFEGHSKSDDLGNKKLIIELMGKHSNIILVNSNHIIIDSLRRFSINDKSYRNILPNYQYLLPISNKIDFTSKITSNEFYNSTLEYIKNDLTLSKNFEDLKLSNVIPNIYIGISTTTVLSIINELKIDDSFSEENLEKLHEYLFNLLNDYEKVVAVPFSSKDYGISLQNTSKQEPLQINYFIDKYYSDKEQNELFSTYQSNLSKLILNYMKKLNNKLSNINKKLDECKNVDLYRLYGELITNNLYRISQKHISEITIENYYDNNNPITIPLDNSLSPYNNAKNYFKKYNKLKNSKSIIELQKQEVQAEINYLESIIYEFQLATTISDIDNIYNEFSENFIEKNIQISNKSKKDAKQQKKTNRSFDEVGEPIKFEIDNFIVLIGKNNKQNDYITKHAHSEDIWFHVKDIQGSHVILKTNNKIPSQETINKCAILSANHSKANRSSNVIVDYTFIKFVKKIPNSKPGMVIYTNQKSVTVNPNGNERM